jgi:hypothetical protein
MATTSMILVSGYHPSGWHALAWEPLRAPRLSTPNFHAIEGSLLEAGGDVRGWPAGVG